jgi:hypothetical protein
MAREPLLMAATGKKGVGKSYAHMILINQYVQGDYYKGIKGRKCLIMDVNDEYGYGTYGVPALSLVDLPLFTVHPRIEIRRIRPLHPNGTRMSLDEWANALFYVLQTFRNGLLLIEDINKFIGDHLPNDLIGAICTNRHAGLDILLSYQSIGRINTKVWGNLNQLRFHKNTESVERHVQKFPDKYEMLRIAEILVNEEYSKGNSRFYVYVDMDELKIRADVPDDIIDNAIDMFVNENYNSLLKPYLVQKNAQNKKMYDEGKAKIEVKKRLFQTYFS